MTLNYKWKQNSSSEDLDSVDRNLNFYFFQVHSDSEWCYLFESHRWVKYIYFKISRIR